MFETGFLDIGCLTAKATVSQMVSIEGWTVVPGATINDSTRILKKVSVVDDALLSPDGAITFPNIEKFAEFSVGGNICSCGLATGIPRQASLLTRETPATPFAGPFALFAAS